LIAVLKFCVPVLMFFAAYGPGTVLVSRLGLRDQLSPPEHVAMALLSGSFVLAMGVWAVGTVRYDVISMTGLVVIAAGLSLWQIKSRVSLGEIIRGCPRISLTPSWVFAAACLVLVVIAVVGSYAPPSDHDTLRYHLTLSKRDLAWGRITTIFGWSVYEYLPPLGTMLNRLAYALGGAESSQILNVLWQLFGALMTALLARRLGVNTGFAWAACLLVLGQRVSINLSSVASIDFMLMAYAAGATLAAFVFARSANVPTALLFGLVGGALANVKHHGLLYLACIALVLLPVALRRADFRRAYLMVGAVVVLALLPWTVRNLMETGNPVFPALHPLFGPENVNIFSSFFAVNPPLRDVESLLRLPWDMFVNQQRFDGLQFGVPFFLILAPFGFLLLDRRLGLAIGSIIVLYVIGWVLAMPPLLRFFIPLFPILSAVSARGAQDVFGAASQSNRPVRIILFTVVLSLVSMQSMFLGATAKRRLPAALGYVSTVAYLESRPFKWQNHVRACSWMMERLQPGERYLALFNDPNYYCHPAKAFPQLLPGDSAVLYTRSPRPPVPATWLAGRLRSCHVKYVIKSINLGADAEILTFAKHRYDALLTPILENIEPLYSSPASHVYDARVVGAALRRIAVPAKPPEIFKRARMQICDDPSSN